MFVKNWTLFYMKQIYRVRIFGYFGKMSGNGKPCLYCWVVWKHFFFFFWMLQFDWSSILHKMAKIWIWWPNRFSLEIIIKSWENLAIKVTVEIEEVYTHMLVSEFVWTTISKNQEFIRGQITYVEIKGPTKYRK